jgi:hypothetical protein
VRRSSLKEKRGNWEGVQEKWLVVSGEWREKIGALRLVGAKTGNRREIPRFARDDGSFVVGWWRSSGEVVSGEKIGGLRLGWCQGGEPKRDPLRCSGMTELS